MYVSSNFFFEISLAPNFLFIHWFDFFVCVILQDAVVNELAHKVGINKAVRDKQLLPQDEVYNGALEDILTGLKNEPYRRADAVRRSYRRRIDNRLSRTFDEFDVWKKRGVRVSAPISIYVEVSVIFVEASVIDDWIWKQANFPLD